MSKIRNLLLAITSGVLLSFPWLELFSGFFIFFAFIPLLILENDLFNKKNQQRTFVFFLYSWLSMAIWNLISFWWAYQPSIFGLLGPLIINSFFYAVVLWFFHVVKRSFGSHIGYISLVFLWLGFEYIHHRWTFAFPWLVLGNAPAKEIYSIQWYCYTGVLGGSLWILLVNLLGLILIKNYVRNVGKYLHKIILTYLIILFLPLIVSLTLFFNQKKNHCDIKCVIVQPNIDPYLEKYGIKTTSEQISQMIDMARANVDSTTRILVFPETAITKFVDLSTINKAEILQPFKKLIADFPSIKIIVGSFTFKQFHRDEPLPPTAVQIGSSNFFNVHYNSVLFLDSSQFVQVYHKHNLLLGAEKMPFIGLIKFFKNINFDIPGGTTWYGVTNDKPVFKVQNDSIRICSPICWESVFGEYVADFTAQTANLIVVITNDGWWGNTNGHIRHLRFSQIRAIETGKYIIRCANTGISAIIEPSGQILKHTTYWEKTVLTGAIQLNNNRTTYAVYGDVIGKISLFVCVLILFMVLTKLVFPKSIL